MTRATVALGACLLAVLALGGRSADAAAPWYTLITGDALRKPVLVDSWAENYEIISGDTFEGPLPHAGERPHLDVALYWGAAWDPSANKPLTPPRDPALGDQTGRFYPEYKGSQAALILNPVPGAAPLPRVVGERGLQVLAAHGIPVTSEEYEAALRANATDDGAGAAVVASVAAVLLAVGGGGGLLAWRLRRRRQ